MSQRRRSVSPFFCFVRDQLPELRRRGLSVARVADAIPHCCQAWALLTEEEKAAYLEKARKWNGKNCSQKTEKETHNLGNPVPASLTKKMPSVTSLPDAFAMSWNNDQDVVADIFYFLDIYSHGKLPSQCEQRFLPCEIGCVRYSLQDGIMADFHHFIDPEAPPRGFRYHCQAAGAETHKIPISGFHLPRTCYTVVLQELLKFAQPARGVQPRFFCRSDDRFRINWCLGRMASVAGIESHLQLFSVEDLIVELYLKKNLKEPSKTWVSRKLDACLWDFSSNTRCKWHEENDIVCCALASCKKIAYCISNSLASVYGVPLTAAHLPLGVSHCGQSTSTRIVKLDAGFQKMKAESSGYDRPFGSPSQDRELIPSNRGSPCGVKTSLGVKEVSYREEELFHF
ncbi:protein maelstrom homolog isoform X2 [Myiozetetes cayanensis]|uniref:protein maelstrom homolog isoform X2 n=1 Tax=Myiozetetes cayanensis TaxID=478635 RepID=UPI00215EBAF7|nr:protein maelstrom homolog isoform X2 [Myiozetetes cayanensis]